MTPTTPLLRVSDIELMVMEKATSESEGESPMFTWTGVVAVGGGVVPVLVPLLLLQALKATAKTVARQAPAKFSAERRPID
ncbi:MAG: hypothetical protein KGM96_08450 [Acidobacteriota bacterium]|nr:hypothetical protein [Acidobacteriota bacterium]